MVIDRDRLAKIEEHHEQSMLYGGVRQPKKVTFFTGMDNKELQLLYSQFERQVFTRNRCV